MKRFQTSLPLKLLTVLLCCLFCGVTAVSAAKVVLEIDNINGFSIDYYYYGNDYLASSYYTGEYREAVLTLYQNNWSDQGLNAPDKHAFQQAEEMLEPEKTNFRYCLLDLDGNIIQSNLANGETMENIASNRYYFGIELEISSGEYYYYRNKAISSTSGDITDLLNDYYIYDDAYYDADSYNSYQDSLDTWNYYCNPDNYAEFEAAYYDASSEGATDEAIFYGWATDSSGDTAAATAASVETPVEDTGNLFSVSAGSLASYDCINFDDYIVNSEGIPMYWSSETDSYIPASSIAPPEDTRERLMAVMLWGIADGVPYDDVYQTLYQSVSTFQKHVPMYIAVMAVSVILCLISLILLLIGTGHKEGVEGIYLAYGHKCPVDLLLCLEGIAISLCAALWIFVTRAALGFQYFDLLENTPLFLLWIGGTAAAAMLLLLPLFTTITAQLKSHVLLKRTLCWQILHLCWRFCCWCIQGIAALLRWIGSLIRGIGLFWKAALVYIAFQGLMMFLMFYSAVNCGWWRGLMFLFQAALLFLVGLAGLVWWLLGWRKARLAAEKLAQGDLYYQTDLKGTQWNMRQHIENLNDISGGMQKAVQEQMKSDRFRTELITNVSHDLKTPLTSIINYVDLLKKLDIQDPQAREYIDVLDRKSQRLKTLTEDLVEASKAATGVLQVNAETLEAGILLRQALGEYEEKLKRSGLSAVLLLPNKAVYILADGRHLWRILDNLLNNCAKYAMPGTRVYLSLERSAGDAVISVKNISAEPLNIPPEELMERFVRGDSSRTNEGSGLGLSIAQSLASIQGAQFGVSVDGDLFKAEIRFREVEARSEETNAETEA